MATSLAGCGGGSDEAEAEVVPAPAPAPAPVPAPAPAPAPAPIVGSATGVFSDAVVEGLAFSATPSGVSGSTNALGQFSYNPGDTISFKLGALSLGAVPAAASLTPIELAAGNADKLKNLLVLLQSLDSDGVPGNGISIPAKAAEAVTAAVDLTQAPATFASSANAGLTAAMAAGGIGRAVTDIAKAEEHFLAQAMPLLSRHVWIVKIAEPSSEAGDIHVVRFGSAGEFMHGAVVNNASNTDLSGIEYGSATPTLVDARGFELSYKFAIDTNGMAGLSHTDEADNHYRVEGEKLVILFNEGASGSSAADTLTLSKADNDPKGLVGVWAASTSVIKTQNFVFWANGKYAMIDPLGDTSDSKCGGPGIEYGDYSYDSATKLVKILSVSHDSNGCAGLSDSSKGAAGLASFTFTLSADGGSASFVFPDGIFAAYRVSN